MKTLNEVFSPLSTRRRYEVWFIRLGLADGSGAWWFRYLLMNPGRGGCVADPKGSPVQVWATWFPREGKPRTFIQGFPSDDLELSPTGHSPLHYRIGANQINEDSCRGDLDCDGHRISWDLHYQSTLRVTLSDKGWIGFSRTPHSDALFSGYIALDDRRFEGETLGFGIQGHNCGYRHRGFWTWAHAFFSRSDGPPSTLEALVYDMPLRLMFRKAVLWHDRKLYVARNLKGTTTAESRQFSWKFDASTPDGLQLAAAFDGEGPATHRLPYLKTDCSGNFEVVNNSLARATLRLQQAGRIETLETANGAVLEMVGRR